MKIQYHRNWENVCKLKDPWLKYLVTWLSWGVDDDEVIAKFNLAFPELFSDHEMPIRIPLSALRQGAINDYLSFLEEYKGDEPTETISHLRFAEWFQWTLTYHRFPEVYLFADEGYDNRKPVPVEVIQQLDGVEFTAGNPVHVTYSNADCLVGYILDNTSNAEMKSGVRLELGAGKTNFMLHLVPTKYIDLTA